jgi:hypothetical protein
MERRIDKKTALLIDATINAEKSHGYVAAASELTAQGVKLLIVIRVLTRPQERRHYSDAGKQRQTSTGTNGPLWAGSCSTVKTETV